VAVGRMRDPPGDRTRNRHRLAARDHYNAGVSER
jgi:hypothetical protein